MLSDLFRHWCGEEITFINSLPESGSNRDYFRLKSMHHSAIGVYNADNRENKAFIYLSEHLRKSDVNVPGLFEVNLDKNIYLQEDLGDVTLFNWLEENNFIGKSTHEVKDIYKRVITEMPKFQIRAATNLDFSVSYPRAAFDYQSMMWDLNYFKHYFLKLAGIRFDEQYLEEDFKHLASFLTEADSDYFLFRDFQSRNIMLKNNELFFIDYQGGRKGALHYDLASLLFESKTALPFDLKEEMREFYISKIAEIIPSFKSQNFLKYYFGFVLIRIMQAMGAYGYRGYFERKTMFLRSIPQAINDLEWILSNVKFPVELPELTKCYQSICNSSGLREIANEDKILTVYINSFSYKKGIPPDYSEHGGGYVFDCRALPNPGRYEEYQNLTGLDRPVIQFLEKEERVTDFLDTIFHLIENSLKIYQQRGFTRLSINFGCTGGQHRSVYSAEKTKQFIENNVGVKVIINHRELEHKEQ